MKSSGRPVYSALVIGAVVAFFAFCCAAPAVHAAGRLDVGMVASSPATGPAMTVIAVSGSGWTGMPDGTPVNFGYSPVADCSQNTTATDTQPATFQGGAFTGWLRLPPDTPANTTYTICAAMGSPMFQIIPANTFTVLSMAQPQLSVSATTLTAGQSATLTGNNFLPPGTAVTLTLQSAGGKSTNLGTATSDGNGAFTKNFTVPTMPTGSVKVTASAGNGMPPTLSASANFTIKAKVVPTPTPRPTPRPTPGPSPTSIPTATAVDTTAATPTTLAPAPTIQPARSRTNPNPTSNTNSQPDLLFIAAGATLAVLLLTVAVSVVVIGRKQAVKPKPTPTIAPDANIIMQNVPLAASNPVPWSNPSPNSQGSAPFAQPSIPIPPPLANDPTEATGLLRVPPDASLEAIIREAQAGLSVLPSKHSDIT